MRAYKGSREDDMIGDALGELQGRVIKGLLTAANADEKNGWYNNYEKVIPEVEGNQWYVKKDVIGIPGLKQQKGRGTPRVIVLVDGDVPQNSAWYSAHYTSFELLDKGFYTRAEGMKNYYLKLK